DQGALLQLAHAALGFGAHQVTLAGVPALDLAVRRELEALSGAAMRLQFQFWFRCVPGHCVIPSPDIRWLHRKGRPKGRPYVRLRWLLRLLGAGRLSRRFGDADALFG